MNTVKKVLFICVHNSGRSQIAEAYLSRLGGDRFRVESAGLEPADRVHPLVVEVMKEEGIDLSDKKPQSVFDLFTQGRLFEQVVAVCDGASEAKCPIFPGITQRLHWPFPDPATIDGPHEEKLAAAREIRDAIKARLVAEFDLSKR